MPKMEDMAGISVHLTQIKCTEIELYVERLKRSTVRVLDHGATLFVVFVGTFWTLFAEDVAYGWPLDKTVDTPFAWASLFFLILFVAEQATRSIVQREDYLFSLFWWMELVRVRGSNAYPCSARAGGKATEAAAPPRLSHRAPASLLSHCSRARRTALVCPVCKRLHGLDARTDPGS
jgi:hypothetical protein